MGTPQRPVHLLSLRGQGVHRMRLGVNAAVMGTTIPLNATLSSLSSHQVRTRMDNDSRVLVKAYRAYLSHEKARSAIGVVDKTGGGGAGHELLDFSGAAKRADGRQDGVVLTSKKQYLLDETAPGGS